MGQQVLSESDGARGDEKNGGSSQWAMDKKWGQLYPYSSLSLLLFSVSRGFRVTCCWICNIIILDLKHIDKRKNSELCSPVGGFLQHRCPAEPSLGTSLSPV